MPSRTVRRVLLLALAITAAPTPAHAAIGDITTIAGTGVQGTGGDGGPATSAQLSGPLALAFTADGSLIDADQFSSRVRKIAPDGTITTIAGSTAGFGGDGGPATAAHVDAPSGLGVLPDGTILVADANNNRVRAISPSGGMSTVAGNGNATWSGDAATATSAGVRFPYDAQPTPDGGYLIADQDNNRVRKVSATGVITTVAGSGSAASTGDGGPATSAGIGDPSGVAVLPGGGFLVTDYDGGRIRKVDAAGTITTVAGGGTSLADNIPATSAQLVGPVKVAVLPGGGYVFADDGGQKVRRVDASGTITTLAGTGVAGYSGDGGPGAAAKLNRPFGIAVASDGDVLIADSQNHRIRRVDLGTAPTPTPVPTGTPGPVPTGTPAPGATPQPTLLPVPPLASDPGVKSAAAAGFVPPPPPKITPAGNQGQLIPAAPSLGIRVGAVATTTPGQQTVLWDFTGDQKADLECPASEPAMTIVTARNQTVTASVAGGYDEPSENSIADSLVTAYSAPTKLGNATAQQSPSKRPVSGATAAYCATDLYPVPPAKVVPADVDLSTCTQQTILFGLVDARSCFVTKSGDPPSSLATMIGVVRKSRPDLDATAPLNGSYSNKSIKFDGMTLTPLAGTAIAVLPGYERIVGHNVKLTLGSLILQASGPLDLNLSLHGKAISLWGHGYYDQTLFTRYPTGMESIGGFPRVGSVTVKLSRLDAARSTTAKINLKLPGIFGVLGSLPPATETSLLADNQNGILYGALKVDAGAAQLGPVDLRGIHFTYSRTGGPNCGSNYWAGSATAYIGPSALSSGGFDLSPTPSLPRNGIAFCNGGFDHAGGQYTFSGRGSKIFPYVRLLDLNFGIGVNPPRVTGGATIQAGFAKIHGQVVIVAATAGQPYTLTSADGPGFGLAGNPVLRTPSVGVAGQVGLAVPWLGSVNLANGYLLYQSPDLVTVAGTAGFDIGVFSLNGVIRGAASLSTGKFNMSGSVQACVFPAVVSHFCTGVDGYVSSKGTSVCVHVAKDVIPGIGYAWGARFPEVWWYINGKGGCKPSHFWVKDVHAARATAARVGSPPVRASAARAGGAVSFTVAPGEDEKNVKISGTGGEPSVQVTGPGGLTLSTAEQGYVTSDELAIVRPGQGDNTYVGVLNGPPGTYTVTPVPGSPPIAGIAVTHDGGDAAATGKLEKLGGGRFELDYDAGPSGGKQITFVETGGAAEQTIGTSSGGKGTLRFTPAAGAGGKRTIVARTVVDGVPAPDVTIATFSATSALKAGKVGHVTARRTGKGLTVSWSKATGATGYTVRVTAATGAEQVASAGAGTRHVVIPGVDPTSGGKVVVAAMGLGGAYGPKGKATYKATARPIDLTHGGGPHARG